MHCLREGSTIEECSFALGRRKATFAGAGPQLSMFAWFQRSTQVRRVWARDARGLWFEELTDTLG